MEVNLETFKEMKFEYSWMQDRTILLAPTGSYAYGTATENSDHDYKGVVIPPVDFFLGLEAFNGYDKSGGKNFKNTKDDVDLTLLHIIKFVKDAMAGVPNNIELLFLEPEQYILVTDLGQMLLENRSFFLSKQIKKKFGGFSNNQKTLLEKQSSHGKARAELVEAYGYDTKFFYNAIRLLTGATEILETGNFHTYSTNREFLLECKTGKYSLAEALDMIDHYDNEMNKAYEKSELPDEPDKDSINWLLIEINRAMLNGYGR